ncbi:dipeptidyl aminopeptidase/acylaminoacyl peptidase [Nocardioides thalensis]|uniref:Dipeptidyl aminopeptidase/acylaminoacyl peptidase n=1 Tax=Nocardioides thalensis TaxID=1914755 RepID=A0A853BUW0_9ACTN|nr:serine hydrolase [Nocardioides thalensis]NYI99649.1 dipeptidyl aminopeptidase/acylaminoacyl peptidase [Nocardioides thalensis]
MSRPVALDDLFDIAVPSDPALSPDGRLVAYVLSTVDRGEDVDRGEVWQVDVGTGSRRRLTAGHTDSGPAWSPAGSLAFLRDDGERTLVLVVAPGSADPREVATLPAGATGLAWSPDGVRLALTAPAPAGTDDADVLDPRAPVVASRRSFRADGRGLTRGTRRHVHLVDVTSGEVHRVTAGDWDAAAPTWSPDGTRLAITAGVGDDADLTGSTQVCVVDAAASGPIGTPDQVTDLAGAVDFAGWSPDGSSLVVVGSSRPGPHNMDLLRIALDTGKVDVLTADLDRMVMPGGEPAYPGGRPGFTADGALLFCARDRGHTRLFRIDDLDRPRSVAVPMDEGSVVSGLSTNGGDVAAVVVASRHSLGEVAIVDATGDIRVLTDHSAVALPGVTWIEPEERTFVTHDGTEVGGVLIRAQDAVGPRPLLLDVHGGPHDSWSSALDGVHLYHQVLASEGWLVLLVNPRGSDGSDDDFLRGALGRWGYADEADFLDPIDQLVAEGLADPARVAVTGYSYGGFAVCHLTARTDRFAAAVVGGGICDLRSFAGTSDMGHYYATEEFGGLAAVRSGTAASPIDLVDRVTTPTLVLHGEADDRCPVGQAEQWFTALRENRTPAELVLYPGASHAFIVTGHPSHRADFNRRIHDWVTRFGAPATPGSGPDARRRRSRWQQRLSLLADRHGVPGAAFGVLDLRSDGRAEPVVAAHGVLSTRTGVAVTPDARFQIGSITKVWTATLAAMLADEGVLELDQPVVSYLPDLDLGSADHTAHVTMRHLLSHTSGLDGDVFTDTGRGDEALARYVADVLPTVPPTSPVSTLFSYCNSGYSLAGRVLERVTGTTWDRLIDERLVAPLGLDDTGTLPQDALLGRVAVGHLGRRPDLRPTDTWYLPWSGAPAGAVWASAADVLEFARLHLEEGQHGEHRLVATGTVAEMRKPVTHVPAPHFGADAWGLGWMVKDWSGRMVIGHDGGSIGQTAFLRLVPDAGVAVVLLTNGGNAYELYRELFSEALGELADIEIPTFSAPADHPQAPDDRDRWAGSYVRHLQTIEVDPTDDGLRLEVALRAEFADLLGIDRVRRLDVRRTDDPARFVFQVPGTELWQSVSFLEREGTTYLHEGLRAAPRR